MMLCIDLLWQFLQFLRLNEESIGFSDFQKCHFSMNRQNQTPSLRVTRAGTRLTVHRSLSVPGHLLWRDRVYREKKPPSNRALLEPAEVW